jgi:hypothetical protein
MAKKKTTKRPAETDKVRVELRLDRDVYEGLKKLASDSELSINQLMHGATQWLVEHGHAGEPRQEDSHQIGTVQQPGCAWFGEEDIETVELESGEVLIDSYPYIAFSLDFTERRAVRDDWAKPKPPQKDKS